MTLDLHATLVKAGILVRNHESDLYFQLTKESKEILIKFPLQNKISTGFTSNIDNKRMIEVPFAYTPFLTNKFN